MKLNLGEFADRVRMLDVAWGTELRFAHWMTNGQGTGSTESGSYAITGGGVNAGTATIPTAAQRVA